MRLALIFLSVLAITASNAYCYSDNGINPGQDPNQEVPIEPFPSPAPEEPTPEPTVVPEPAPLPYPPNDGNDNGGEAPIDPDHGREEGIHSSRVQEGFRGLASDVDSSDLKVEPMDIVKNEEEAPSLLRKREKTFDLWLKEERIRVAQEIQLKKREKQASQKVVPVAVTHDAKTGKPHHDESPAPATVESSDLISNGAYIGILEADPMEVQTGPAY